jgi:putative DNA primase/helicase
LVELVTRVGSNGDGPVAGVGGDALPTASEILLGVPEGERNDTLFRWACKLRRQLGDDRGAVEVLVRTAAGSSGLDGDEVALILSSAFAQDHSQESPAAVTYGVSDAQMAWAKEAASLSPGGVLLPAFETGTGGLSGEIGSLAMPLTDDGNSLRFVREVGQDFRYVARHIWHEVAQIEDKETAQAVEKWAKASQMRGKIEAMLAMVRPKLAVSLDSLDANDWLLNVRNGTVDLRTGELRAHSRDDLLTQIVDTDYIEGAEAPRWSEFVEMVLPDPNVRWFVQKAIGYSLTGVTDAKAMFILYGSGNNGKSVFLEALRECVIGGYAGVAPKTLVMMERDEHATQLAGMQGKRFVTLSEEVEEKDRLRTATLKSITGGDEMTARFMRQDFFNFTPKLKLWIATNHRPGVNEFGDAMRTRLRLVPFTVAIPVSVRRSREEVLADFRAERSGLLTWALSGLAGWLREGLESPSVMSDAVEDWFSDEDVFGQWIAEVGLVSDKTAFLPSAELHRAYTMWMMTRGEERFAISPKVMGRRLASAGFTQAKVGGARGWLVNFAQSQIASERG